MQFVFNLQLQNHLTYGVNKVISRARRLLPRRMKAMAAANCLDNTSARLASWRSVLGQTLKRMSPKKGMHRRLPNRHARPSSTSQVHRHARGQCWEYGSCRRFSAQMGRREMEHGGGKETGKKGKPAAFVLSCA
jgi:hypothetical protein